jgi:hypothetical protein
MKKTLLILLVAAAVDCSSQKVELMEGSLAALKGETTIQIEFTYNDMEVGTNHLKEVDYIKQTKDYDNSKEPGRGETWEKAWYANRKERFEPLFINFFEKASDIKVSDSDPKYKLIFHTTMTEPGITIGSARGGTKINAVVLIVALDNPTKAIAKIFVSDARGVGAVGYDLDSGIGIQGAYASAGKLIGKLIADAK